MPTPPLLLVFLVCFSLFTPVCRAQAAINSIANSPLPLRNVLIEVRQVQKLRAMRPDGETFKAVALEWYAKQVPQWSPGHADRSLRQLERDLFPWLGDRPMHADSAGNLGVQGQIQARQGQQRQSDNAVQQVLVLNGRSARINLGARTPMRVVQTFVRNGTLIAVPTTVVWESGTGFTATPRWDGSNTVELELGALQTSASSAMGDSAGGMGSAGSVGRPTLQTTTSTLAVSLGEWTTVAQSDTDSDGHRSDVGGNARWATQASSEVQVRLTVP